MTRKWATWAIVAALAVHATVAAIAFVTVAKHAGDFDRFWTIATSAGRPYRDYHVEYPPGTVVFLTLLARASGSIRSFRAVLLVTNAIADAAILIALAWGWGRHAVAYYAVVILPILTLLFFRMDLWSVALTTIAVAAWSRDHPMTAAMGLAVGTAVKLWPLPFGTLLLVPCGRRRSVKAIASFAALIVVVVAGWWAWAGSLGFYDVLTFRHAHGWNVESTVGGFVRLIEPSSVRLESGSLRAGTMSTWMSLLMFGLGTPVAIWSLWRGGIADRVGAGWVRGVSAMLLFSALLSPQFLGWLVPGAAIAFAQNNRRLGWMSMVAVLLTAIARSDTWSIMIIPRNVMLAALLLSANNGEPL